MFGLLQTDKMRSLCTRKGLRSFRQKPRAVPLASGRSQRLEAAEKDASQAARAVPSPSPPRIFRDSAAFWP